MGDFDLVLQLVMLLVIVVFAVLNHRSIPLDKVEEINARFGAHSKQTPTKIDDSAYELVEFLIQQLKAAKDADVKPGEPEAPAEPAQD